MRLGAIEAGGTKFVLSVGDEFGKVEKTLKIPTTDPQETMTKVVEFFQDNKVKAIGLGAFGPVDLDVNSKTYGYIKNTPKKAWRNFNILGSLDELNVPVGIDTDVNVCAYAESVMGAAKDVDSCLYITVGTGIGAGAVVNGETIKGMIHPEMGHVAVRRHKNDAYKGGCPSHGDCLEGMASGPNHEARIGKKATEASKFCPGWEVEAYYLAQGIYNFVLTMSVEKVILWGGIMHQEHLFTLIREEFKELNNGYLDHPLLDNLKEYITKPDLGDDVGVIGCLLLAKNQL